MKRLIFQNKLYLIGAAIGAIAGYFYWQEIGCSTGTCAITSKPFNSTVYFSVMGALFFGMFAKDKPKENTENASPDEGQAN